MFYICVWADFVDFDLGKGGLPVRRVLKVFYLRQSWVFYVTLCG